MNNNIAFTLLASLIIGIFGATMAAVQFTTPVKNVLATHQPNHNPNESNDNDNPVCPSGYVYVDKLDNIPDLEPGESFEDETVEGNFAKVTIISGGGNGIDAEFEVEANFSYDLMLGKFGVGGGLSHILFCKTTTITATPSASPSPSVTVSPSPSASPSPSVTVSPSPSASPSPSVVVTPSVTISPTVTTTVTPSITESPTPTPTTGAGPTATPTPGPVGGTTTQSVLGTTDTEPTKSVLGASTLAGTGTFDRTMANVFAMTAILFFILSGAAYAKKNR